jgi:protein SCO1/2
MKLRRAPLRIGLVFAAITMILIGEWAWLRASDARGDRPNASETGIALAPFEVDFSLIDHNENPLSLNDLGDRHALVLFGYTHCPDVCPTELSNMAAVLENLGDKASALRPLFITVDPERDTAAVLADYVSAFDDRIVGLTGTAEQSSAAAHAFRVYAARVGEGPDYLMDHNAALFLIAPGGQVAAYFRPDATTDSIAEAIRATLDRVGS